MEIGRLKDNGRDTKRQREINKRGGCFCSPPVLDFHISDQRDQIQIKYKLNMNSLFDLYLINLNQLGVTERNRSFRRVYSSFPWGNQTKVTVCHPEP